METLGTSELGAGLGTDYFRLRHQLTAEQRALVERVRTFVDDEVRPVINGYWERADFPWELARKLGRLGILGEGIADFGCPALDPLSVGLAYMELARGDGSLATFAAVQGGLVMQTIDLLGSEEQKRTWLPRLARVEKIGAFALTEPDHGSDSIGLGTTARRDGDSYVLEGSKRWIGNGTIADVVVVWARDVADGEVKGFLVEKGAPGYEARVIEGKASVRAVWQADIRLDQVRVPAADRLPHAHSFADTARVLEGTRASCAWFALGHAVAGYDAALTYAHGRRQFGRPLTSFQIVQQRLVRMLADVTAMQLYCIQLGRLGESGHMDPTLAGLAKLHNTTKARAVLADARDLLGGNGILLENHVMKHMCDIEAVHTFEGTETMQTLIVGRDVTGVSAFR